MEPQSERDGTGSLERDLPISSDMGILVHFRPAGVVC